MKDKIKGLIKKSSALDESKKAIYLAMVDLLPKDKLSQLLHLFEKEQARVDSIENDKAKEKSQINGKYIDEAEALYTRGYKDAVGEEEEHEKEEGEQILKKLDNV